LLSGKTPGRESYPGDIFYQHSHLFERAGNFKDENGGGSITALPVLEVNLSDFATFLPTNLVGMTDGHLLFNSTFRNQGQTPAIDISLSVTRVGRQTQKRIQNLLSGKIRQLLAQAAELETISKFSAELPFQTRLTIKQKEILTELMNQENSIRIDIKSQIVLLGIAFTPLFLETPADKIKTLKQPLLDAFTKDAQLKAFIDKAETFEDLDVFLKELTELIPVINKYLGQVTAPEPGTPIRNPEAALETGNDQVSKVQDTNKNQ
jgi:F-type H+-transporting ATPase subunit alpha